MIAVVPDEQSSNPFEFLIFWYRNEEKIEALFSQLNGQLEDERKEVISKGRTKSGRLGIQIGGLLAFLGLVGAKGEGHVQTDYERILEVTTSLSFETKVSLFRAFLDARDELTHLQLLDGSAEGIVQAAARAKFATVSGLFTFHDVDDDRAELKSVIDSPSEPGPLCRAPLSQARIDGLGNQVVNVFAYDGGEPWPHEILCECIVRPGFIVANPIAAPSERAPLPGERAGPEVQVEAW